MNARVRLSASEVARSLGLSVQTVHSSRKRGQLRAHRTGRRHWYYEPSDIEDWIREWYPAARSHQPRITPAADATELATDDASTTKDKR